MTRWLKASLGLVLAPLILSYVYAKLCYRENEWPWEGLED